MSKIGGIKARVEKHSKYKIPRRIYDIETSPRKEQPRQIAESVLKKIAKNLKIKPDLSDIKFDKVKVSILGSHVLYQQYHQGKPISGAWIRVDIDKEGRIYNINNDMIPESAIAKTKKPTVRRAKETGVTAESARELSADEARRRALSKKQVHQKIALMKS